MMTRFVKTAFRAGMPLSLAVSLFAMPAAAFAAAPLWTLGAPSAITFSCGGGSYPHTLDTVVQDAAGNLSGTGHYDPNAGYTWDLTGTISGNDIAFTIVYTGIALGSTYNSAGVINPDGSITGTTDSNCQSFSMPAGSATAPPTALEPATKDECKEGGWMDLTDAD